VDVVLWIVASVLSTVFLTVGAIKVGWSKEMLAASSLAWTEDFGRRTVKLIGALEMRAAMALIVPALVREVAQDGRHVRVYVRSVNLV
jgi:hypothetical protein